MELIASVSSALLDLSIQQVSTHAYPNPASAASRQVIAILPYHFLLLQKGSTISLNETSSSSHVCDRMAYFGKFLPMKSSKSPVLVLISLISFGLREIRLRSISAIKTEDLQA